MKKLLAFLLAVIITVTVFTVSSAKEINTMSEDVRFSLEQETGDIKWLDGIKISSLYSADRVLLWENVFTPANGDIDSELSFIKTGVEYDLGDKFNGLSFDWYDNFCFRYEIPEFDALVTEAENELADKNGSKTVTYKLLDHYEYYPLFFTLNLPDVLIQRYMRSWQEERSPFYHSPSVPLSRADGFLEKLCDFIKIPVREDDEINIVVEQTDSGFAYSSDTFSVFNITCHNAVFEEKLYFGIYNRIEKNGEYVDMSHIPGGNGIYALPFSDNDIYYEDMKNVYPLDDTSSVIGLHGDTENSVLYLMLSENGKYILKIIDEKTMTDISELELFDYAHDEEWVYSYFGDSFAVFLKNDCELKAVARGTDGAFNEVLNYNFPEEKENVLTGYFYESRFIYDGNRIVACIPERDRYSPDLIFQRACGLDIFVFSDNSLCYHGKWSCSLGEYALYKSPFCQYINEKIKIEFE